MENPAMKPTIGHACMHSFPHHHVIRLPTRTARSGLFQPDNNKQGDVSNKALLFVGLKKSKIHHSTRTAQPHP
jgi:hypothetical protein